MRRMLRFLSLRTGRSSPVTDNAVRWGEPAFTLIELLVVIGIISLLLVLLVPAITSFKGAGETTAAIFAVKDVLEEARSYAIANNTYSWVGFFEDDPTLTTQTQPASTGSGRVIISLVASTDGTRIYTFINSAAKTNSTLPSPLDSTAAWGVGRLIQVRKLLKLEGIHLIPDTSANSPLTASGLPAIATEWQVGHPDFNSHPIPPGTATAVNPTTFDYPISSLSPAYRFTKVIEFNPRGEAMKIVSDIAGAIDVMTIGLQQAHGNVPAAASQNPAGLTVSALTGGTRIYRPGLAQ